MAITVRSHHRLGLLGLVAVLGWTASCSNGTTSSVTTTDGSGGQVASACEGAGEITLKPEAEVPEVLPTELVITDIEDGCGSAAVIGDTVVVNYVGVRSLDGVEFDSSYGHGTPFPVLLGEGGVIEGWEQGLAGTRQGMRRRLDIPSSLAYGQNPPAGGLIKPGDALSFVIDVVAVIAAPDAADSPTVTNAKSKDATVTTSNDLVVGNGPEVVDGSVIYMHIVSYRGDTGAEINTTWSEPGPVQLHVAEGEIYPGLLTGALGMRQGGRRRVVIPPADGFGAQGNTEFGLPAGVDLVAVIDVVLVV